MSCSIEKQRDLSFPQEKPTSSGGFGKADLREAATRELLAKYLA